MKAFLIGLAIGAIVGALVPPLGAIVGAFFCTLTAFVLYRLDR
jgi:hypothetical protein